MTELTITEAGMLFRDMLSVKLGALKPRMSADAIHQVIERLEVSLCKRPFAAVAAA